jgi:hypothetical protein
MTELSKPSSTSRKCAKIVLEYSQIKACIKETINYYQGLIHMKCLLACIWM